jgi:hypothetical protein
MLGVAGIGTIIRDSLQRLQSVHLVILDNCSRETEDVVQRFMMVHWSAIIII